MTTSQCPCQSGASYADCCAPFHDGKAAPTAETLMRSRYSAYALKLADYINQTWCPDTLSSPVTSESLAGVQWIGLTIHEAQNLDDTHATVKFTAVFAQDNQQPMQMTENSQFILQNGKWLYVDGTHT